MSINTKKYYFTIKDNPGDQWDKAKQIEYEFDKYSQAYKAAMFLSKFLEKEVRLSTSAGLDNNGDYIFFNSLIYTKS
jgi:hypothetical protein